MRLQVGLIIFYLGVFWPQMEFLPLVGQGRPYSGPGSPPVLCACALPVMSTDPGEGDTVNSCLCGGPITAHLHSCLCLLTAVLPFSSTPKSVLCRAVRVGFIKPWLVLPYLWGSGKDPMRASEDLLT